MSWRSGHKYKRFTGKNHNRCEVCGKGNCGSKVICDDKGPVAFECRYCQHLRQIGVRVKVGCKCDFCMKVYKADQKVGRGKSEVSSANK